MSKASKCQHEDSSIGHTSGTIIPTCTTQTIGIKSAAVIARLVFEEVLSTDTLGASIDILTRETSWHLDCAVLAVISLDEKLRIAFQAGLFGAFHTLIVMDVAG